MYKTGCIEISIIPRIQKGDLLQMMTKGGERPLYLMTTVYKRTTY